MASQELPGKTFRRWVLRRWVPFALFAIAFVLTIAASWYVSSTRSSRVQAQQLSNHERFLTDAERTRQLIQVRLNTNVELIRAGAALLAASNEISHVEFRTFVAGLQLHERYPEVRAIGFAPRVRPQDVEAFRQETQLDGITALRYWHPTPRPEHYPILLLEPTGRTHERFLGYDIPTDPTFHTAMERARDTGQPTASGTLTSASPFDESGQPTFVVLVPVYRVGMPVRTIEDRRGAVVGFVFSPVSASALIQQIVKQASLPVVFEVYDGSSASPERLLGELAGTPNPMADQSNGVVNAAGREWLVVVRSTDVPSGLEPRLALEPLLGGLLLSALLFLVTRAQIRAWEAATRHEMELRASQEALRQSEAEAQAADRAKDEFLATLSHELRTPLNTILGWVTMLRGGAVRAERQAHALAVIERNARLQSELIEDLLDISRIVVGKMRLRLRPVELAPLVAAAVESLRPSAEEKGLQLESRIAADPITVRADPERVQQIVWNLVSNAVKFTPPNGRIEVELKTEGNRAHLSVRDTGVGITPEFLPHVFERFRQADSSTTRAHTGLGLGMAIVRHLVELQGGSIEASSDGTNRGALFVVRFPLASVTTADSSVALIVREGHAPVDLEGVRILVVDDDPSTREVLTEALGAAGARVMTADSALQAVQLLRAESADVLISDIAMPAEDGLSLIRRVRALSGRVGRIPAIALTAFARAEDRAQALEAGYQMHIAKPIELNELEARVAELLQSNPRPGV
jgi:signal transduction histidine kinase/ActR/RegA family two-component response regulator